MDDILAALTGLALVLGMIMAVVLIFAERLRVFRSRKSTQEDPRFIQTTHQVKAWAKRHGMQFYNISNHLRQAERMEANRGKRFFEADDVMTMEDDGPFAAGVINGRKVWLYVTVGKPHAGSLFTTQRTREITVPNTHRRSALGLVNQVANLDPQVANVAVQVLHTWCLEVQTHPIPHWLRITRKGLRIPDEHDTESRAFEDRYDVSNFDDSLALQLLDPSMIDRILQSRVDALEFSDSSVVLYEVQEHINEEVLESMLSAGLQIAEQVDRNYPLSKYTPHPHGN